MVERRKHKRIQALIHRESIALVRHNLQTLPANIADLSVDGALLQFPSTRFGFDEGSSVSVWLDSGGTLFEIQAVVIRTEPGYVAVRFSGMTRENDAEVRRKLIRMEMISSRSKTAVAVV
ncbi:MAG TPA: PilZ domain-containing protein [Terriglobia bacterium]